MTQMLPNDVVSNVPDITSTDVTKQEPSFSSVEEFGMHLVYVGLIKKPLFLFGFGGSPLFNIIRCIHVHLICTNRQNPVQE